MRHMLSRRGLSLLLAGILLFQTMGVTARAQDNAPKAIELMTAIEEGKQDSKRVMYYTDDYFASSSYVYNPSLATASLCLAMGAFGSNHIFDDPNKPNYTKAPQNFVALMKNLGCTKIDIDCNTEVSKYYQNRPDTQHVAFGIAQKQVADAKGQATLIVIGVRGANYESEWAGNVNVGQSGDHEGFRLAARQVIDGLRTYIARYGVQGRVKLWISGFSRAAATSNLAAGYLDQAIDQKGSDRVLDGVSLAKSDLYAYTFETPAGTMDANCADASFGNIYNFVNPNDIVPKVAPYLGGNDDFRRYGVDLFLPSSISDANNNAWQTAFLRQLQPYLNERGITYDIDKFRVKYIQLGFKLKDCKVLDAKIGQHSAAAFANTFLNDLVANGIHTRAEYAKQYQQSLMTLMGFLCGCAQYGTPEQVRAFKSCLTSAWYWVPTAIRLIVAIFDVRMNPTQTIEAMAQILREMLASAREASGVKIPDSELDAVQNALKQTLNGLIGEVKTLNIVSTIDLVLTLALNANYVLQAHDPDVCFAWLQTMDANYCASPRNASELFQCGEYRVAMVWGKASVTREQLDAQGQVVSSVTLDENGTISGDTDAADGAFGIRPTPSLHNLTYYYMPSNGHYRLKITNMDNNVYTVGEYSPKVGDVKRVFTYTQNVPKGSYVADFPAYTAQEQRTGIPDGSSYSYALQKGSVFNPNGKAISLPSKDLRLAQLRGNYATLCAATDNAALGQAMGGGVFRRYSMALLQAVETENGDFLGWSVDGSDELNAKQELSVPVYLNKQTYTAHFAFAGKPTEVRATLNEPNAASAPVTMRWQAPSEGDASWVTGYRVYRKRSDENDFALVAEVARKGEQTAYAWDDSSKLTAGQRYDYGVTTLARQPDGVQTLESRRVQTSVTVGTPWRLTDHDVTVQGYSLGEEPSGLTAEACAANDSRNSRMRVYQGETFLGSYAISLQGNTANIRDGLRVTIPVRASDGTIVRIQQDVGAKDGKVRELSETVRDGELTLYTTDAALGQFCLTTLQKPAAPSNLRAYNSAAFYDEYQVTVEWEAPTEPCMVDCYLLYREGLLLDTLTADETSYVDDDVQKGASYTYRVTARNAAGDGAAASALVKVSNYWLVSGTDAATGQMATVHGYSDGAAPTGLNVVSCTAENPANTDFHLLMGEAYRSSWTLALQGDLSDVRDGYWVRLPVANAEEAQHYHVQQKANEAAQVNHMEADVAGEGIEVHTPTLSLGQFFVTTLEKLSAPTELRAVVASMFASETPSFTLNWRQPDNAWSISRYVIYRDGVQIGTTQDTAYTDDDSALEAAIVYTYAVAADNGQFESKSAVCEISSVKHWSFVSNGAKVEGYSDRDAPYEVSATSLQALDPLLKHMRTLASPVLNRYEIGFPFLRPISLLDGSSIRVALPVTTAANGRATTVQHDRDAYGDGDVETLTAVAQNGYSTVEVENLSPFMVNGETSTPPQTGDSVPIEWLMLFGAGSLLAMLWLLRDAREQRKRT